MIVKEQAVAERYEAGGGGGKGKYINHPTDHEHAFM